MDYLWFNSPSPIALAIIGTEGFTVEPQPLLNEDGSILQNEDGSFLFNEGTS